MLIRLATLLVAVALSSASGGAAAAASSGGVTCPPDEPICIITVDEPGGPGSTPSPTPTSGGGTPECSVPTTGEAVDCYDPTFGWWSNSQGCYFMLLSPQPPTSDPIWLGHPANGAIYLATCLATGGSGGGWVWLPSAPDGYGGTANPATLAQRALDTMRLDGPDIGIAPTPGGTGLVGLPVWMWTDVRASTWGPATASASIPGITVTATARASRIVWEMGDGHTVTCTSPGTPYTAAAGGSESPTCGYVYTRSSASQPAHAYAVTATTTWVVAWSGGGQSGELTTTRSSRTTVRIGELQVLLS